MEEQRKQIENAIINKYVMLAGWLTIKEMSEATRLDTMTVQRILQDEAVRGSTARQFALCLTNRLVSLEHLPKGAVLTPQELQINLNVKPVPGRPRTRLPKSTSSSSKAS